MQFFRTIRTAGAAMALVSTTMMISSCGDGGGSTPTPSPPPPPPPVSTKPSFTSAPTASVVENSVDAFYTATASDPQGDAITFSVYSGADAADFVISSSGALRFDTAANYDLPGDQNGDNVYEVILRATAGGETTDFPLKVTVQNDKEGVVVTRVATGIVDPVGFSFIHNDPRLLIAEKGGRVLLLDPATGVLSEESYVRDHKRRGEILAVAYAFPGQTYQEGIYLITHDAVDGLYVQAFNAGRGRFAQTRLGDPWADPVTASMAAQGSLYVAIGDAGGDRAQLSSSPYGKLHELRPYSIYSGASIPSGDTLVIRPSIIGDGIQKPGGFTHAADYLYLADQGSLEEHELTIFRRDWRPLDFGWPFYEGAKAIRANPPAAVNGPTITYDVGDGDREGTGIVAGILNSYNFLEELGHTYVFADTNGTIWTIEYPRLIDGYRHSASVLEVRNEDFAPDIGSIDSPIAITTGYGSDHFYILDADGEVFRVEGES